MATSELHGYWQLPEPRLSFDPVDTAQVAFNPLAGLSRFGPYSERVFSTAPLTLRIALLAPRGDLPRLRDQLNQLVRRQEARERAPYLPNWPGFEEVFRAKIVPADDSAQIPLPTTLDADLQTSNDAHQHLAQVLIDGLRKLYLVRDRFDVIVFYLPSRYGVYFADPSHDFDLHDMVKASAAQLGLPTQIITDKALNYRCRASVAWRLGTALYAKAGGTPWKIDIGAASMDAEKAYIGISYAIRTVNGSNSFVTCCSQVFDSDGGGMEFVAYDLGRGVDMRNPYLSREDMRLVMSRSLAIYQNRHAGHSPRRLVIHKKTPFQAQELDGCIDAWGSTSSITCASITEPSWRGVSVDAPAPGETRGRAGYAIPRGTAFQLDGRSVLVWVDGNAPAATLDGATNFYQSGKGIPRPLLITRDAGSGPLEDLAHQILALSKMNWNNDALYDRLPTTLRYADILARTIKHIPRLASRPYDYRLFM